MSTSPKGAFDAGVFSALADFGFDRFATPKLIRILYLLGFVVVLLYGFGLFVVGITQGGVVAFFTAIGVPIGMLLSLLYLRVAMELLAVVFRVGQNTSRMVELAESGSASAGSGTTAPGPGGGYTNPPGVGGPSSPPPSQNA
jgi:hypothetical protein